jgi:hypothetical protein
MSFDCHFCWSRDCTCGSASIHAGTMLTYIGVVDREACSYRAGGGRVVQGKIELPRALDEYAQGID